MTVYPHTQTQCTPPAFEDIPFEEPNLDNIAIRAPYVSRHGACDNIGTQLDGSSFNIDDLSSVDLSSEDFNSMFEQVISQSRPSAGRAVLACSPIDPYLNHYSLDSPMVSGACAGAPYRSKVSPPLKRPAHGSVYDECELKPLSLNTGGYCGSNIYWPGESPWSDQQRTLYQQYGTGVSRPV